MRSLTIALDLTVDDKVSDDDAADELIEWLLDISDGVETPAWLLSFDNSQPRRPT